jgi:hypothetical protein
MDQDPLSAVLLQQAVELNAVAGRLLDSGDLPHRRILTNRISDAVTMTTAALNMAAGRWHSDFLSRLRRIAGLRAAEASVEELERLVCGVQVLGYAAAEDVAPVLERLAAIRAMVDALANGEPAERPEAA